MHILDDAALIDPLADEICRQQEAEHKREFRRLSDLAFVFLNATDGDIAEAERLLDDCLNLLCEGGVLSTWRYRLVLNFVREGL